MSVKRLVAIAIVAAVCAACIVPPGTAGAQARVKYKWRLGTLAPRGVGYAVAVEEILLPDLNEACNGELGFKVYWGGVLGDDRDHLNQMKIGKLHGAGLSGQGSFIACPETVALGLPFLFSSFEEIDHIKRKMIDTIDGLFMDRGMKILAWVDQDFDQTYSIRKPLKSLADFEEVQFVNWMGRLEHDLLNRMECELVEQPDVGRIAGMFRDGEIEAGVAPAIWMVGAQLYSVVKYVNPLRFRYTPVFVVVTTDAFNELPPDYRHAIEDVRLGIGQRFCDRTRLETKRCLQAMFDYGVTEVESSEEDVRDIRRRITPLWYELAGDIYPPELLDELLDHLAAYRSGGAGAVARASEPGIRTVSTAPASPSSPGEAVKTTPEGKAEEVARTTGGELRTEPQSEPVAPPTPQAGKSESEKDKWATSVHEIKFVQSRLQALGYYPYHVDGILGPITYRGIKSYQKDNGLPSTGTITPELISSLAGSL
ncbi:MAG: TRAP transporter substrate-binding protein DctP [Desulfatibacillaceae bacterium]